MDSVGSTTVAAPSGDGRDHKSTRAVAPPEPDESASEGESDDGGKAAERKVNANDSDDDDGEEGEDDDGDGGYDSDTQIVRIADSAASFARRCIASGELSKALLALQNAVQVAEPTSAAYAQCVLLLAQLFQLSGHVDASLQCVLGVYKCMPAPYTLEDGLVVIARLYERESAHALAALWWNKLIARQQQATSLAQQRQQERQAALRRASALADFATRSFAQRDFVFARDAHRELFDRHQHYYEKGGQLSYAFMRKCLHSTLQVRDLAANHKLERTQLAWGLARMASGLWPHDYADPEFYNLRSVYSASFPAIYKVVFAWDDAPARVLAQWWRACRERQLRKQQTELDQQRQEAALKLPSHEPKPGTRKRRGAADTKSPPRAQARTKAPETARLRRAPSRLFSEASTSPTSPEATSKTSQKRSSSKRTLVASTDGQQSPTRDQLPREESEGAGAVHQTNQSEEPPSNRSAKVRSPAPSTCHPGSQPLKRSPKRCDRASREHQDRALYENSPTKRKLSAVRRLRTQHLADELSDLPPHSKSRSSLLHNGDEKDDPEDAELSRNHTLLDVYALPSSPTATASFLDATGRSPGFADLDLDEVEKYVRVVHYRARVLTQKHVAVKSLSEERVKPQWLVALEKSEMMITDLQQQQEKQPSLTDDDTPTAAKPHLTQIHSRVVFQLTAILKQYKRDFGDTGFTRELHALKQRLSAWKCDQVPMLLAAIESAKQAGMSEEKQRNLEFYHVHEGHKQQLMG